MGFSVDFTDNKSISAQELNSVIAELGDGTVEVSSEFVDDKLYYTDKLNCIRSEIVTGGVASGCEAALCETGIIIGEGLCFFDNGMRMKIDSEGISLGVTSGEENFVYLYASPMLNIATAVVTTEEKTGSEYVPICKIKADGALVDARMWCRAKIPMLNSRFAQTENFTIFKPTEDKSLLASFPLINKAYSYIVFITEQAMALYTKDTGKFLYITSNNTYGQKLQTNTDFFVTGYSSGNEFSCVVTIEEENGYIKLYGSGKQAQREMTVLVL